MLYNVIDYSNQIIGQVEAGDTVEAWSEAGKKFEKVLDVRPTEQRYTRIYGQKLKVTTDAPLFYTYLTDREREFRERDHPLKLSDVTALGSHYGEFEISEEGLDALVEATSPVSDYKDIIPDLSGARAHHMVWIGKWELGMSWDRKLVYARRVEG